MSRDQIAELVRKTCADVLMLDNSEIAGDARLREDLAADSLDFAELAYALEEHKVHVRFEELDSVRTLDDLVDALHSQIAAR